MFAPSEADAIDRADPLIRPVPDQLDLAFSVPFVHRVRFTHNVLGGDQQVLLDVLHASAAGPARVLACVENSLDAVTPIRQQLRAVADRHPDRMELLDVLTFPGGEHVKNEPAILLPLLQSILDRHVDRQNYVLAVGGGAFLDAVGLAAALAHRGIRLIRLPTTVTAQADSGLGVKNAVNFFGKKNWLGTFAVPWAVINDHQLLQTLSDRDWRCGFSEAIKVALLKDPALFRQICAGAPRLARRDWTASEPVIRRSAYWHLQHIARGGDPFETQAARPLDFGHWSAHRLEVMTHFALRHGEAVAIGLAIDCTYSQRVLGFPAEARAQVLECLAALHLPVTHPALNNADALLHGLEEFREHLGGQLSVTLLRGLGEPVEVHEIDRPAMREAIRSLVR